MYDVEKITSIIKDIEKYEKDLDSVGVKSIKDLDDLKNFHACSMICFSILNRVIDLGQEILIKEDLGMPNRYADIFLYLSKAGLMNKKEAEELAELINFRNIIAHAYFEVSKKNVFEVMKKISLIDKFIEKIKKRIR